jgi:hypothetical protein
VPRHRLPERLQAERLGRICLLLSLVGCSGTDDPVLTVPVAPADRDRESWQVRLQLHSETSGTITVEAPYITDHIDVQQTRADSGVSVTLSDTMGALATRLSAHRLVVDHRANTVALAGTVHVSAPERRVTIRADTLTWDRTLDQLDFPAGVTVTVATGQLSATHLAGASDLEQWRAVGVQSTFRDTSVMADEVRIEGATTFVRSDRDSLTARFDTVTAFWRGRDVRSGEAVYRSHVHRLELSGSVTLQDSGRQVQADSVIMDLAKPSIVAWGHVRGTGDVHFEAEQLQEDELGRWRVSGSPAWLEVDDRRVEAVQMSLSKDMDSVSVGGGVRAVEAGRRIQADSLRLIRSTHQLDARGAVQVAADDIQGAMQAENLRSTHAGDRVLMWGNAQLIRQRQGQDLVLLADTLQLDGTASRVTGLGSFELHSPPGLELQAEQGMYQTTGDTATFVGQSRFLYDADGSSSRISADSCRVILDDGEPVTVEWPGPMEGRLEDAEQNSWLSALSGSGELVDGRLASLILQGQVEVTHQGTEDRLSLFTAESMQLNYGEGGILRRVQAEGDALVRTRLPGQETGNTTASFNEVSGQRLEVELEAGAVVAVRVLEAIEGRFVPDDDNVESD